jgi:hypothetical protein
MGRRVYACYTQLLGLNDEDKWWEDPVNQRRVVDKFKELSNKLWGPRPIYQLNEVVGPRGGYQQFAHMIWFIGEKNGQFADLIVLAFSKKSQSFADWSVLLTDDLWNEHAREAR